ncbi:MAG: putative selenate reductase subunit YgfK [Paratractidigestivibacter faecalis]|uniref:putative selenate reductase subunit YgfK n=1 Tax=Paratractidigestivibacter faecalis TaxID=2292441 RepID=UPI0026E9E48B|nr:putative selenate reductase subunit YgfK [Paratractidigestivibacter faecalis]MDD6417733.1 putative selenate reductase subunit YgfK [Paratractidigestivibacter faecalis]
MSDIMRPIPFAQLMDWILTENAEKGSIFGIRKIVRHEGGAEPIFAEKIETPFGPAAGPNSQLTQNIVASYVAGARFFELKTVQVMDGEELSRCVAKPCIVAEDECYNCEWSTELEVPQAMAEYIKAWWACKLLARELGLGDPDGFVFNMSVGYDLAGIQSPKVDAYIEGMKDASGTAVWAECRDWALANLDRFQNVDADFVNSVSPHVSASVTESTLHGCPPDEIERIATYLITEKGLNTYVKCNPTLLGYDYARERLNGLGFDYIAFDDRHFREDLQWGDAVPMFRRLMALAQERGLAFGVKLTNTFPVDVTRKELPSEEMYMSGRSLFPLSITLARKISEEFDGKLRISYSGGADAQNIKSLYGAGIWPITMATTVLKPGGYERFSQIAHVLEGAERKSTVDVAAVVALDESVATDRKYAKPIKPVPAHKLDWPLPLTNCFISPCRNGCPIEQDIPAYLAAVDEGRLADALAIIAERNALPFITGNLCPHPCGTKCMRAFYEPEGAAIRASKLKAARGGIDELLATIKAEGAQAVPGAEGKNVAVIGGGPAGLACAFFLTRAGAKVTIFERKESLGGVARHIIPAFRISDEDIDRDVELCRAFGAEVKLGVEVADVAELKADGYTDVVVCTGAWAPGHVGLEYGDEIDVLDFLAAAKSGLDLSTLGTDVVIVGAGNTAMDAARVAKRLPGVQNVRIVYRRTKRYMPADEEELAEALSEGVELCELLAPKGVADGVLTCDVMELGEPDESGRRSPVATGKTLEVPATAVICAVGEKIEAGIYEAAGVQTDRRGRPAGCETGVEGVWAAGDCRRGPARFVDAIADAQEVARKMCGVDFSKYTAANVRAGHESDCYERKGDLRLGCAGCQKSSGCLGCATVCEACCDVCPNRANVSITVPGLAQHQVVHVDGMCNECGNCAVFCPWSGRPFKDKLTLFWSAEDMGNSTNQGFLAQPDGSFLVRLASGIGAYDVDDASCGLPEEVRLTIKAVRDSYAYLLAK